MNENSRFLVFLFSFLPAQQLKKRVTLKKGTSSRPVPSLFVLLQRK